MVRTTDEARELLTEFARRHGVSVSALLEAIARRLPVGQDLTPHHGAVVSEARSIDAERRRRD